MGVRATESCGGFVDSTFPLAEALGVCRVVMLRRKDLLPVQCLLTDEARSIGPVLVALGKEQYPRGETLRLDLETRRKSKQLKSKFLFSFFLTCIPNPVKFGRNRCSKRFGGTQLNLLLIRP